MLTDGAIVAVAVPEPERSKPIEAELATIATAPLRSKMPMAPIASIPKIGSSLLLFLALLVDFRFLLAIVRRLAAGCQAVADLDQR